MSWCTPDHNQTFASLHGKIQPVWRCGIVDTNQPLMTRASFSLKLSRHHISIQSSIYVWMKCPWNSRTWECRTDPKEFDHWSFSDNTTIYFVTLPQPCKWVGTLHANVAIQTFCALCRRIWLGVSFPDLLSLLLWLKPRNKLRLPWNIPRDGTLEHFRRSRAHIITHLCVTLTTPDFHNTCVQGEPDEEPLRSRELASVYLDDILKLIRHACDPYLFVLWVKTPSPTFSWPHVQNFKPCVIGLNPISQTLDATTFVLSHSAGRDTISMNRGTPESSLQSVLFEKQVMLESRRHPPR